MKYQVLKIEKNYIGTFNFEDLKTTLEMFSIFMEEAKKEGEELDITQALYLTINGHIKVRWEK